MTVEVSVTSAGQHSGSLGGIVPDVHRLMRQLLGRIEDVNTGKMLLPELFTRIPVERQAEMKTAVDIVPDQYYHRKAPFLEGVRPNQDDAFALLKANTWEPSMAVIGSDGIPSLAAASPVLHKSHKVMLAIRLPPLVDAELAAAAVKDALEKDPPYGAKVSVQFPMKVNGFHAQQVTPQLEKAMHLASEAVFGKPAASIGAGGTIPLMNMLQQMFPETSLVVCGVVGQGSNEHGPNESLSISYTKQFTASIAMIMGLLEGDSKAWPDDVPKPFAGTTNGTTNGARKARFCFTNPGITVGDCACCF
eukprot:TRINITY_DN25513_c0_g1_i1.p1 TRINITY_DN25513_c0_g1~~TRINITY_DN25513_c0_g1_i1.p1  ORF type:complete len:305 (+),score=61.28 TRINITY_DN25513_c0_g1_i1:472-1386(+)